VKAGAQYSNYDITCPTETTQGMLVDANADGILMDSYSTLWYILPTTQLAHFSQPNNFRLLSYNSTQAPAPNWILLATRFNDPGATTIKWLPGEVTLPIPDENQQLQWNANLTQLGRGVSSRITLNGSNGSVSAISMQVNGNAVVDVASNQTITGLKTISNNRLEVKVNTQNIRCCPASDGNVAEIAFFRNNSAQVSTGVGATNDVWALGHNTYNSGDRNFGIGCNLTGRRLSLTPTSATIHSDLYLDKGGNADGAGRILCTDQWHSIILRGDASGYNDYAVNMTDAMTFVQYGGTWKFRRITQLENTLVFQIGVTELQYMGMPIIRRLPTGVVSASGYPVTNIPTNCFYELSISGYCASQSQPWILCNAETENNIWINRRDLASPFQLDTRVGVTAYSGSGFTGGVRLGIGITIEANHSWMLKIRGHPATTSQDQQFSVEFIYTYIGNGTAQITGSFRTYTVSSLTSFTFRSVNANFDGLPFTVTGASLSCS
jgi:hypothetical protein